MQRTPEPGPAARDRGERPLEIVETLFALFAQRGEDAYFGEPVSQQDHALQAAYLAEQEHASDALVVAALLHDIGHLIHGEAEDIADRGVDARHEAAGEAWLRRWFGPEVTEPVRLHVAAKRYLCATDPGYLARLSPASVQSLALQGGPFTPAEVQAFEANPHCAAAVRLRRWDDAAKIPDLPVPGLEHYRERLKAALARRS
jgi:phosphonate degradation associated HDIG domain protein